MRRKKKMMKKMYYKELNNIFDTKQKNVYHSKKGKQIVFPNKDHKPEPELEPEPPTRKPEPKPKPKPEPIPERNL